MPNAVAIDLERLLGALKDASSLLLRKIEAGELTVSSSIARIDSLSFHRNAPTYSSCFFCFFKGVIVMKAAPKRPDAMKTKEGAAEDGDGDENAVFDDFVPLRLCQYEGEPTKVCDATTLSFNPFTKPMLDSQAYVARSSLPGVSDVRPCRRHVLF